MRRFAALQVPPDGGHAPQIRNYVPDGFDQIFNFFLRRFLADGQAQGAMGDLVGPPDGQQHMAGVQGPGGTGGPGGGADPLVVQQEQQGFSLDALETEVDIAGEPLRRVAVQDTVGDLREARHEPVPQGGNPDGVIEDVKFETFGCGSAIASSSMATELIKGKPVSEAIALTNKAVAEALDGLPAHKLHCSVLAEEAIKAALKDYYDRQGIAYDPAQFPDCAHCEDCGR